MAKKPTIIAFADFDNFIPSVNWYCLFKLFKNFVYVKNWGKPVSFNPNTKKLNFRNH